VIKDRNGVLWATSKEIRRQTGQKITDAMLQNWHARKGLPKDRGTDDCGRPRVRYPLYQAAQIWRDTRPENRAGLIIDERRDKTTDSTTLPEPGQT
jgi:hypothetical protein